MKFSLQELTNAFRKAKADAWLRHDLNEDDYLQYENNFKENILAFKEFIEKCPNSCDFTVDWLGGWRLMAKKINMKKVDHEEDMSISSDPNENFRISKIESIAYRVMATPTVNFQLLSSLWILTVGWKYEKLLHKNIYGNRLRPLENGVNGPSIATRGSFRFYRPMFTRWKRDGIESLSGVLKGLKGGRAIVVTADAKAFFHSLKPDFLLDDEFLSNKNIQLTNKDRALTQLLINAINDWAKETPLKTGLPVGLAASSVIANLALLDFDDSIENLKGKVFYGRYVDDVLIVFRDRNIKTRSDVWNYIAQSSGMLIPFVQNRVGAGDVQNAKITIGVQFVPKYSERLTNSRIIFTGEKCRAFFLDEKTGPSFVKTLTHQIQDVTSEFRYLPRNIFEQEDIECKIQKLLTTEGEAADNFRKIAELALRKRDLKELLREMRFLLRTLPSEAWKEQRAAFYQLVIKHLMLPPLLIEYAERDFPQIISLAILCGDFNEMDRFLECVYESCLKLMKQKAVVAGSSDIAIEQKDVTIKWIEKLFSIYTRCVKTSLRVSEDKSYNDSYEKFRIDSVRYFGKGRLGRLLVAQTVTRQYVLHDLAAHSYVDHLYRGDVKPLTVQAEKWRCSSLGFADVVNEIPEWIQTKYINAVILIGQHVNWPRSIGKNSIPFALLFPTRPVAERDLVWLDNWRPLHDIDRIFEQLRGYRPGMREPEYVNHGSSQILSRIIDNPNIVDPTVALLNIKTTEDFCCHNINEITPKEYYKRLKDIVEVVNAAIAHKERIDYLVLHELSLPLRWFIAIAGHCTDHGISLIAGITYNVTDREKKLCKNEVCMALVRSRDGSFSQPEFLCEAKKTFSREEEHQLNQLKPDGYKIDDRIPLERHAVVRHGAFAFSTLICSELLEIGNRSRLRGLIDALFVVAWNKDVNSFSPIVDAAAMDLHAFVILSNNNLYGDSRIRAPVSESWARDIVRLKGGEGAFYIVGKLHVVALRNFQQNWNSERYFGNKENEKKGNEGVFKPIPPDYESDMAEFRRSILGE